LAVKSALVLTDASELAFTPFGYQGWRRCGWFFHGDFFLLRSAVEELRPPKWSINQAEYQFQPYPLNDAEWRELVGVTHRTAK
jgi:hypothetical protein